MALPSSMTSAVLTVNTPIALMGNPIRTVMTVMPSSFVVWAATGDAIVPLPQSMKWQDAYQVELPHVDQVGFLDAAGNTITNFAYTVTVTYTSGSDVWKVVKTVQPLTGQDTIDFDMISQGPAGEPVVGVTTYVSSINGLTGAVVMDPQQGPKGDTGATGPQGVPGTPGAPGSDGSDGLPGAPGTDGATGATGAPGADGAPGATGATGADGAKGDQGIQGNPGTPGADGAQGMQGLPGNDGAQGLPGNDGATGPKGDPGDPATVNLTTIPAGSVIAADNVDGTQARPSSRTDLRVMWIGGSIAPVNALAGDVWMKDA